MMHLVADINGRPLASFTMGVIPSDVEVLGSRGELIADWVERGCPALRGVEDTDGGFSEVPVTVPASDPLWGLAFLDALDEHGWEVSEAREGEARFAEWTEELHPRDDVGKFTESGAGMTVKKAPPANKDQIAKAVEMKKAGKSYKEIQDVTGLNPKQAANIIFKANKIEKAIIAAGGTVPEPVVTPTTPGLSLDPSLPLGWKKDSSGNLYDTKNPSVIAYTWAEKTKENSPYAKEGDGLGKYAYFKDGVQVSGAFASKDQAAGAASIGQGKGPASASSPAPSSAPSSPYASLYENIPIPIEKGVGLPGAWPISDNVERRLDYNPDMMTATNKWVAGLTSSEREVIREYTKSEYMTINAAMRAGLPSAQGTKIMHAIDKASTPPPPELVWRGLSSGQLVAGFEEGDVVTLNGITSGSIRPGKAYEWGSGHTVFEIKPTKGAFVRPISSHPHEDEYIMPHGAKYTVRGFSYVNFEHLSQKIKVLQLEMHP